MPFFFNLKGTHRCDAGESEILPSAFYRPCNAKIRSPPVPQPFTTAHENWRDKYEHHLLLKWRARWRREAKSWLVDYFKQAEGDFFVCTPEEGNKAFYTVSPLRAQQFVIRLCIPMKSETFWRWISLCGVTTPNGMSIYRRRSTASWCTSSITAILCAASSIRITS